MSGSWWILWAGVIFFILAPPIGYGWGYRGWGAPYPRYVQRRRAAAMDVSSSFDHQAWGLGGDLVWIVMILGMFWAFAALLWW